MQIWIAIKIWSIVPSPEANRSKKFRENLSIFFWVILLTNKQTNKQTNQQKKQTNWSKNTSCLAETIKVHFVKQLTGLWLCVDLSSVCLHMYMYVWSIMGQSFLYSACFRWPMWWKSTWRTTIRLTLLRWNLFFSWMLYAMSQRFLASFVSLWGMPSC